MLPLVHSEQASGGGGGGQLGTARNTSKTSVDFVLGVCLHLPARVTNAARRPRLVAGDAAAAIDRVRRPARDAALPTVGARTATPAVWQMLIKISVTLRLSH